VVGGESGAQRVRGLGEADGNVGMKPRAVFGMVVAGVLLGGTVEAEGARLRIV
jgi:hypothetical protein